MTMVRVSLVTSSGFFAGEERERQHRCPFRLKPLDCIASMDMNLHIDFLRIILVKYHHACRAILENDNDVAWESPVSRLFVGGKAVEVLAKWHSTIAADI